MIELVHPTEGRKVARKIDKTITGEIVKTGFGVVPEVVCVIWDVNPGNPTVEGMTLEWANDLLEIVESDEFLSEEKVIENVAGVLTSLEEVILDIYARLKRLEEK